MIVRVEITHLIMSNSLKKTKQKNKKNMQQFNHCGSSSFMLLWLIDFMLFLPRLLDRNYETRVIQVILKW